VKLFPLLTLVFSSPFAHADFAGCYAVGGGLFGSQTFSSCYECKGSGLYCQEICATTRYTCTSRTTSSSVAPWLDGTATDDSQPQAAWKALEACQRNVEEAHGSAVCLQATCVSSAVEQTPHACR